MKKFWHLILKCYRNYAIYYFAYFHNKGKPKWLLVEEKVECVAPEVVKERTHDIETCAKACKDISSMFIFGTNDFGDNCVLIVVTLMLIM